MVRVLQVVNLSRRLGTHLEGEARPAWGEDSEQPRFSEGGGACRPMMTQGRTVMFAV